jgi:phage/plasmid-associated DNA primase
MVSETGPNDSINENFVKSWTGSDEICVRALYKEEQKIRTQAKLIVQTNNKPKISADRSILDRTHFSPFQARFSPEPKEGEKKADPNVIRALSNKYLHEVFLWMLRGSIEFYSIGSLKLDSAALKSTLEFFEEHDHLTSFVRSRCVSGKALSVPRNELYSAFQMFSAEQHISEITASEFYSKLLNKGFSVGSGGKRKVYGLRLRAATEAIESKIAHNETVLAEQVEKFIASQCYRAEDARVPRAELYARFQCFCFVEFQPKQFYAQLRALGLVVSKNGQRLVSGIQLRV